MSGASSDSAGAARAQQPERAAACQDQQLCSTKGSKTHLAGAHIAADLLGVCAPVSDNLAELSHTACSPVNPTCLQVCPKRKDTPLLLQSCSPRCSFTERVTMLAGITAALIIYGVVQVLFMFRNWCRAFSRHQRCKPSAVLLLGGDAEREQLAAELVAGLHLRACAGARNPELLGQAARSLATSGVLGVLTDRTVPVYASSPASDVPAACRAAGGAAATSERIAVDTQAVDTVSNFTTLAPLLYGTMVEHVLVLTSGWHAKRAAHVATVVLGDACGIAFTVAGLPSSAKVPDEGWLKCLRDELRAHLWLVTGALLLFSGLVQTSAL